MFKTRIAGSLTLVLFVISACKSNSPTATPAVSTIPTEAKPVLAPIGNECIKCHTDKQRLIDTAKPEVVVEKESSGAG